MKINLTSLKFKELPETVIPSLKHLHEPIEPIERMKLNDEEQKIWEKLLREHIKTTQRCSGDEYMKWYCRLFRPALGVQVFLSSSAGSGRSGLILLGNNDRR